MIELMENFDQQVREIAKKFPDEVVEIGYSPGYDWIGDPAVFFRVLLTEAASRRSLVGDVAARVEEEITDSLQFRRSEYMPFFYFRSKSEQERLKDPEWGYKANS